MVQDVFILVQLMAIIMLVQEAKEHHILVVLEVEDAIGWAYGNPGESEGGKRKESFWRSDSLDIIMVQEMETDQVEQVDL